MVDSTTLRAGTVWMIALDGRWERASVVGFALLAGE
jgi:hypothetical protein